VSDRGELAGRIALVTGGGGGIGSVIATELHGMGASVVVAGRRRKLLDEVVDGRDGMLAIELDVTDEASWTAGLASIEDAFGAVDVLVTSAGVIKRDYFLESDPSDWEWMWRTNVVGTMLGARAVLPSMLEKRYGRIVLVSSIVAHVGLLERTAYGATKGAVEAFGRSLAREIAGSGVTVNSLAPGAFRTEINKDYLADGTPGAELALAGIPERRFGDPTELAAAVRFLVLAGYSQGATVNVDGGWSVGG
jgi:NAD(P)-dependent dehydrogenase (short-subunit alcohol dehydrogenase family)